MKSFKLFLTVLFLAVLSLGNVWAAESATMATGTNGTAATVNEADAIKVGTSKAGGSMTITVGAGATKLEFYAAAWKGVSDLSLNITPAENVDGAASVALTADDGIANNSPFTLTGSAATYKHTINLKGITTETTLTFTSSAAKRFVVWGATYTTGSTGDPDPVASFTVSPASINFGSKEQGSTVDAQDVTVTLTNTDYAIATISGTNASAFEIVSGEELTATGTISVRPTTAALAVAGTYSASLDVEADGVEDAKSVALSLTVTAPFDGVVGEIVPTNFTTTSYAANNGSHDIDGMKLYTNQTYQSNSLIQMQKTAGYIYNETTLGEIAKIEIAYSANNFKVYEGDDTESMTEVTGPSNISNTLTYTLSGKGFFKIVATSTAAATASSIKIYYIPVKSTITLAACEHGSVGASATADVKAGTEITLTNTPAAGYKLSAYDVYKTGEVATKVTVTDGKFTMPAYDVTVSATFEVAKVFDGTELTLSGTYPTEFWKGETFSHAGMTVTAHFNTGDETVTGVFSGYDMATAGVQTVTVTFTEGGASQTATYNITVKTIANTQETAYTTTEAIAIINAGKDLSTEVYVKGKVSQVDSYNSTYKSITYWLDANAFEVYGGLAGTYFDGAFSSKEDIAVGADVIVKGTITDYKKNGVHQAYEFNSNNVLVYYLVPEIVKKNPTLTLSGNVTNMSADDADNEFTVSYDGDGELTVTSSDDTKATATIDGTTVTIHALATGSTTITISAAETETYNAVSKSYTLTVAAGLSAAALPFSFNGGRGDMNVANGIKHEGLGSDYSSAPKLKFDTQGDYVVIRVAEAIKKVSYTVKGNGYTAGQFDVLQSADNQTYTTLMSLTDFEDGAKTTAKPAADTRYIKFVYTSKNAGNVALGNIEIVAASAVEPAGLAFEQASYRFVTTATKTVAAVSAKGSTGAITYSCEDANLTINASTGAITCTVPGTYTVKAAIAATAEYEAGEATCTVKVVEPAIANSIIVAETTEGKVFAMTNTLSETYVTHVEIQKIGDKYLVDEATYDAILYQTNTDAEGQTTIVSMSNMYLQATAAKKVSFTESEYFWTLADGKLTAADADYGTLQYNVSSPRFTTYTSKVGQYATIVSLDKVVKNVMSQIRTGLTEGDFGTMCQANDILYAEGAIFFEIEKKNAIGLDLVEAEFPLEAGKPYLYQATAAEVNVVFGNEVATVVVEANGLVGRLSTETSLVSVPASTDEQNIYVIQKNNLRKVTTDDIKFLADRAYINYDAVTDQAVEDDPMAAPRRRVTMGGLSADVVTSMDEIATEQGAVKFIENGVLYILRDGKRYNAQGQLVK